MAGKNRKKILACRSKVRFHTPEEAWAVAERMRLLHPGHVIDGYQCPICRKWHVGHRPFMPLTKPQDVVLKPEQIADDSHVNPKVKARHAEEKKRRQLMRDYARQESDEDV